MAHEHVFNKHKLNQQAATLLIQPDHGFLPSGIHCLYYSAYQLVNFMLHDTFEMSKEDIFRAQEDYKDSGGEQRGSHELTIMIFYRELTNHVGTAIASAVKNNILELKLLRKKADYDNLIITELHATLAISKYEPIIQNLYSEFKLE